MHFDLYNSWVDSWHANPDEQGVKIEMGPRSTGTV